MQINLNLPETPQGLSEPTYSKVLEIYNALHTLARTLNSGDAGAPGPAGPPGAAGSSGPPGAAGEAGANGAVPYFISSTEIFTVPLYKQMLFQMLIDNEGVLDIDGYLIEVD